MGAENRISPREEVFPPMPQVWKTDAQGVAGRTGEPALSRVRPEKPAGLRDHVGLSGKREYRGYTNGRRYLCHAAVTGTQTRWIPGFPDNRGGTGFSDAGVGVELISHME